MNDFIPKSKLFGSVSFIFFQFLLFICTFAPLSGSPKVVLGIDNLLSREEFGKLKGKHIGIITNHTAINGEMQTTADLLKQHAPGQYKIVAFFAPEHGLRGQYYASEAVVDEKDSDGIPIYSLHGDTRRPTQKMLRGIDFLIYDIQDLGTRSYTYLSTLLYVMEEAARRGIKLMVLDRPNPINGVVCDGPMLEEEWRSFLGYINVPYCHGMTIGELAQYFNGEYKIGCNLEVIPMKGWKRTMTFKDTKLPWVPTSPHIPEAETALLYPVTGILGELGIVNIGVGYTLPFKLIGAPWIDAEQFTEQLNEQKFPGVHFTPFYYRPFYGKFEGENCAGSMIIVTDPLKYKPVAIQYLILGILKRLYPEEFKKGMADSISRKNTFCKVCGTEQIYRIINDKKQFIWDLRSFHEKERKAFLEKRKAYLFPDYVTGHPPSQVQGN